MSKCNGTSDNQGSGQEEEDLVPVFVPSLLTVLGSHENEKRRALSQNEVEELVDRSVVVLLTGNAAEELEVSRGYVDIDPESAYSEWIVRKFEVEGLCTTRSVPKGEI